MYQVPPASPPAALARIHHLVFAAGTGLLMGSTLLPWQFVLAFNPANPLIIRDGYETRFGQWLAGWALCSLLAWGAAHLTPSWRRGLALVVPRVGIPLAIICPLALTAPGTGKFIAFALILAGMGMVGWAWSALGRAARSLGNAAQGAWAAR